MSEIWNTSPRSKEAIQQSCRSHTFSFSTTGLTCYTISDGVCSRVYPRAILVASRSLANVACVRSEKLHIVHFDEGENLEDKENHQIHSMRKGNSTRVIHHYKFSRSVPHISTFSFSIIDKIFKSQRINSNKSSNHEIPHPLRRSHGKRRRRRRPRRLQRLAPHNFQQNQRILSQNRHCRSIKLR